MMYTYHQEKIDWSILGLKRLINPSMGFFQVLMEIIQQKSVNTTEKSVLTLINLPYLKEICLKGAKMILLNKELNRFLLFVILTKKCKGCRWVFCIRFLLQIRIIWRKNAGQCFSNESEATCKNFADLEEKKRHPKRYLAQC